MNPLIPTDKKITDFLKLQGVEKFILIFSDPDDNFVRSRFGGDKFWTEGVIRDTLRTIEFQRGQELLAELDFDPRDNE